MQDAEFHVFSDSVLWERSDERTVIKLTNRWNDYLEQFKESVRFIFHIHPGKQAKDIVREMDEWIRHGQEENGQFFYVRNLSSSSSFHGNDERNSEENGMNWQS